MLTVCKIVVYKYLNFLACQTQNLTGRLGFAFFFPPDKFAYVHVKQITRHEIHVFNNEMDGSFMRTLALSRV